MSWSMRRSASPGAVAAEASEASQRAVAGAEHAADAPAVRDNQAADGSRSGSHGARVGRNRSYTPDEARLRSDSMSRVQSLGRGRLDSQAAAGKLQWPDSGLDDGIRAPPADGALLAAHQPSVASPAKDIELVADSAIVAHGEAANAASSGLSTSTTTSSSASDASSASNSSSPSSASSAARGGDGQPSVDPDAGSAVPLQPTTLDKPALVRTGSASRSAAAAAATAIAFAVPCSSGGNQPSPATALVVPAGQESMEAANAASAAPAAVVDAPVASALDSAEGAGQFPAHPAPATAAALRPVVQTERHAQTVAADGSTPDIAIADRPSAATREAAEQAVRKPADGSIAAQASTTSAAPDVPPAAGPGAKRKRAPIVWSAARAAAARTAAPASAASSAAIRGVGAAGPPPPEKRPRRGEADSAAAALVVEGGTGTAPSEAAAAATRARSKDASIRKTEPARPATGGVSPATGILAGAHALAGEGNTAGAARVEAVMPAPATVRDGGSGVTAESAEGPKPPRVSALKRLRTVPVAAARTAEPAAASVRDADELLQPPPMPAIKVRACPTGGPILREASQICALLTPSACFLSATNEVALSGPQVAECGYLRSHLHRACKLDLRSIRYMY